MSQHINFEQWLASTSRCNMDVFLDWRPVFSSLLSVHVQDALSSPTKRDLIQWTNKLVTVAQNLIRCVSPNVREVLLRDACPEDMMFTALELKAIFIVGKISQLQLLVSNECANRVDDDFQLMLDDPQHVCLFNRLKQGEATYQELEGVFSKNGMTLPPVVGRLEVMTRAGILDWTASSCGRHYRLTPLALVYLAK